MATSDYDYDQLYPGRFMKAGEFKGRAWTMQIEEIRIEELEGEKGKRDRGILMFKGAKKGLVLNRTNGECLKAMWGRATREWVGKRVTLYPTNVPFGKEMKLAIRIYGSPDIPADLTFELKLPKKKAQVVTLKRTEAKSKPNGTQQPAPTPPIGEPPPDVMLPGQAGYSGAEEPPPPGDADAPGGVQ